MSSIQRGWLSSRLTARSDIPDLRTKYIPSKADKRNPHLNCRFRKKRQVRKDEEMQVMATSQAHQGSVTLPAQVKPAPLGAAFLEPGGGTAGRGRGIRGSSGAGEAFVTSGFYCSALKAVPRFPLSGHPLTKGRGKKWTELKSRGNIFRKVESTK